MKIEMTAARWRRIEDVFSQALDLPTDQRPSAVRKLAGGDPTLADAVLSLLEAAQESSGYLEGLAARLPFANTEESPVPDSTGRLVGPYRLTRLLGHGGMGSVYLAERADGAFDQTVAVKLLPLGRMQPALERRFRAERQILARMEYPHIARLLDGGVTDDGTPYFVMEYVDGLALSDYCERHALSTERRLGLFLDVCGAVEAAHRNLVIHRDLKPANVLVTSNATVKLLDFGIAKLLTSDEGTTEGHPLSPAYASPEQLEGRPLTTAVDVWGLGVILYELLAGRRAFAGRPWTERSLPPPPSSFRRAVSRDLDTLVAKAIQTEPERRYASVALLADDVRRYLEGLPIRARAESWAYRLRCFARRHRYGVTAAALIVALLGALTVLSLRSAAHARDQAVRIAQERDASKQVMRFLVEVFAAADPAQQQGQSVTARELLDRGAARVHTELSGRPEIQATLLGTIGRVYRQLGLLDQATPLLEQALAQRQRLFTPPHLALAEALHELGLARWSSGRSDEAEKLLRQGLAMRETLYRRANEETVASRIALGRVLTDTGRPADGVRELQLGVQQAGQLGEEAKPMEAQSLYNLAMALHHHGKMSEAADIFRQAAALYRRLPIAPTPESAESLLMLAGIESAHRPGGEVESLYAEALEAYRRLYGVDHPKYADALRHSANVTATRAAGLAVAEAQMAQAVQIYTRLRIPDQAGLAIALIDLGDVRRRRGNRDGAEQALAKGLVISRRIAEPLTTAIGLMDLAQLHRERGQLTRAVRKLDEAAKIFRETAGPKSPMLLRVAVARGELMHLAGQHQTAQTLLGDTLKRYEAMLGPKHVRVARTKLELGICLLENGRRAEARPLLLGAEAVLRSTAGPDDADTRRAAAALKERR